MVRTKHNRESFYRKLLQERHDNPDIPIERFCRQHGISLWTFYHWRKRLGHSVSVRRAPSFLPVTIPQPTITPQFTEIKLPDGAIIRFSGGFEKEMFRVIVAALSTSEAV